MNLERLGRGGRTLARRGLGAIRQLDPRTLYRRHEIRRWRERADAILAEISVRGAGRFDGRVLVDAMWDNPNYWVRYAILRAAVGPAPDREVGVLGPYRAAEGRRTLARLGISRTVRIEDLRGARGDHRREARRLLAQTTTPEDILSWSLPHGVPADFVYDGILKRQRAPCVDLHHPGLVDQIAEALGSIAAAHTLLDAERFALVVLSHGVNFQFAALAWIAAARGIPVILLYGNYGVPRFVKVGAPRDLYDTIDCPGGQDLADLTEPRARALAAVGRAYLAKRRRGQTDDIGARYAFREAGASVTRAALGRMFGWDPDRPVVGVYAPNWFDFPHPCGMSHFRDFLDWMEATVAVAVRHRGVNWILKAHPCDQWYGGVTLSDLVPSLEGAAHVRVAPTAWNGSALLDAVDAVVTYHGTVGVEAAAAGRPVLVADRGWYHDAGFVKWPRSRAEYLEALTADWWKDLDLEVTTRRAEIFAGWYFGRPSWQGGFVLEDDTVQAPIYRNLPDVIASNPGALAREVDTVREWLATQHRHYHTFKMSRADEFHA